MLEKYRSFIPYTIVTLILFSISPFSFSAEKPTDSHPFLHNPEVKAYISQMVKEHQFSKTYLESIFASVKLKEKPKVVISLRKPLEEMTWDKYKRIYVSAHHIRDGKAFMERYKTALMKAEKTYGVPASILVATIGIESNYGKNIGKFRVIDTLANLAFTNGRRKQFFKKELTDFLVLSRDQHLNPLKVMGSYTGAIGLPQFMPSSYRNYGVNFSGDRGVDLEYNVPDAIASIANYYQKNGWHSHQIIAFPTKNRKPSFGWFDKNITAYKFVNCGWIPDDPNLTNQKNHCVSLRTHTGGEKWLGFHNFIVIQRYNHSVLYAMAVFQLSYNLIRTG